MRESFPSLYVILDAALAGRHSVLEMAEKLAAIGVQLFQLRNKADTALETFEMARRLITSPAMRGARLIVNDRPDIAALLGKTECEMGAHVGQHDLLADDARKMCPAPMWVGVSTHNLSQVGEADLTSADYVAFGPVFATMTKANPDPVTGLSLLAEARRLTRKPLVAIGGITVENAGDAYSAGADSVAVARAILHAPDPAGYARELLSVAAAIHAYGRNERNGAQRP